MKRLSIVLGLLLLGLTVACSSSRSTGERLREWRRGVWLLADGNYAIYTDTHYFVVQASGEGARSNVYCGSSQIRYTDRGVARRQTLRLRKLPDGELQLTKNEQAFSDNAESPLEVDAELFEPGRCNTVEGVIYDSVTEATDGYVLLATCDGDREKIYADGRSAYLPASGGEYWAYRVESW